MNASTLVGRQPIYDNQLNVIAYELLFRSAESTAAASFIDGDKATSQLILNTFLDIGLENIVGQLPAYINLTRNFILEPDAIPFDKQQIVLEILEDIIIDDELIQAVRLLHNNGYTLALDDYRFDPAHKNVMDYISVIKIDILEHGLEDAERQVSKLGGFKGKLLAEKIESVDEFEFCKSLGFDYYQGFFLSKPKLISGQRPPTNRLAVLNLLAKLYAGNVSLDDIKNDILTDVTLSYRLLRYLNSSYFALSRKIETIDQALIYLGLDNIRRWLTIISLSGMSDKPNDIIITALIRGKMCELLAEHRGESEADRFFTVGLFSNLPALLGLPIEEIVDKVPFSRTMKVALTEHSGILGETLQSCIDYEQTQWDKLDSLEIEYEVFKGSYLAAIHWANNISREIAQ